MGIMEFLNKLPVLAAPHTPAEKKDNFAVAKITPVINSVDEVPAHTREKAIEKQRFITLVKTLTASGAVTKEACAKVAALHAGEFPILSQGGKNNASQLTYNNYRNWTRAARGIRNPEMQLVALADKYTRGNQPPKGDDRFWKALHSSWLGGHNVPITQAYLAACQVFRQVDPQAVVPTLHQARYQLLKVTPHILVLGKEGEEAYKNLCCPYIDRDWSGVYPGQCLVGDSRTFDTRVKVWDEENNRWIGVRPIIAGLMDAASWYLASYWITTEPVCADTIIDALRLYTAVAGNQPPAVCYFDNGADYCAQGFAKDMIIEGKPHSIFRELGIQLVNAIVKNPRAKTIERLFREIMQQFDKIFPDYLGSKPEQRTMDAAWFDKHPEELPTLEQFCQVFAHYLDEFHNTPKNGKIHKGKSPREIWDARPERPAFTDERLKMAFLKPIGTRIVCRGPAVQIDNRRFFCNDLEWNTKVMVKTESINPDHVYCFKLDGTLIGEATPKASISALALDDESARNQISDGMANGRRQLKNAKTFLHDLTGGGHLLSILELTAPETQRIITEAAAKKPIHKIKGQQYSFKRNTLPEAFPEAEDIKPKPKTNVVESAKVDRKLLDIIHQARHQVAEAPEEHVNITIPEIKEDEQPETPDYRAMIANSQD